MDAHLVLSPLNAKFPPSERDAVFGNSVACRLGIFLDGEGDVADAFGDACPVFGDDECGANWCDVGEEGLQVDGGRGVREIRYE